MFGNKQSGATSYDIFDVEDQQLPHQTEKDHLSKQNELKESQLTLQKFFEISLLPLLAIFVKKAMEKDEMFMMYTNMLNDLLPYIYGYIAVRTNDFRKQKLVAKMMFERVFVSQQSLYKHILKENKLSPYR